MRPGSLLTLACVGVLWHPLGPAALQNRRVADFLGWSRLPFADIQAGPGSTTVTIGDARYNRSPGDGFFVVRASVARAP